jgi:hypothetical protein
MAAFYDHESCYYDTNITIGDRGSLEYLGHRVQYLQFDRHDLPMSDNLQDWVNHLLRC